MHALLRPAAIAVSAALLLTACGDDGPGPEASDNSPAADPAPTDEPEEPSRDDDASEVASEPEEVEPTDEGQAAVAAGAVDIGIECLRGDTLQELPYDPALAANPGQDPPDDDTRWVVHTLTMTSNHDTPVQVASEFGVEFLAEDGSVLATGAYFVAFDAELHLAPGETVVRRRTSFEGLTGLLGVGADDWGTVYGDVASCELGEVTLVEGEAITLDPTLVAEADFCTVSVDGNSMAASWFVENTTTTEVAGRPVIALRDDAGRRVATNFGPELTLAPETTTRVGGGMDRRDLPDPDADVSCELQFFGDVGI